MKIINFLIKIKKKKYKYQNSKLTFIKILQIVKNNNTNKFKKNLFFKNNSKVYKLQTILNKINKQTKFFQIIYQQK